MLYRFYIYNIQILYRCFSISPDKTSRYCGSPDINVNENDVV